VVQGQVLKLNSLTIKKIEIDICIANRAQNKILKPTNQKNHEKVTLHPSLHFSRLRIPLLLHRRSGEAKSDNMQRCRKW
jgi:hypothetical protein